MNLMKTHPVLGTTLVALATWAALLMAVLVVGNGTEDVDTAIWIGAAVNIGLLASLARRRVQRR